jgi:hypothetical protein
MMLVVVKIIIVVEVITKLFVIVNILITPRKLNNSH